MSLAIDKPWQPLTADAVAALPGALGVYEVADAADRTLYIGFAGGRSLFGLRSELQQQLERRGADHSFRFEVNAQYWSRHHELLMLHQARTGDLPAGNHDDRPRDLGRLSPA